MSDYSAIMNAFFEGVTVLLFCGAGAHFIGGAIKQYREANREQAVRNHK